MNAPKRIVVVDDDAYVLRMAAHCLRPPEFELHAYGDARDALMRLHDVAPDLIVCDVLMPGMDGRKFFEVVKKSPQLRNVPFVFLSGVRTQDEIVAMLEAGADDFLAKPFPLASLVAKIRATLRMAERLRESGPRRDSVAGQLGDDGALPLLRFCRETRLTGRVTIESAALDLRVEFVGGEVAAARASRDAPADLANALLAARGSSYWLEQRARTGEEPEAELDAVELGGALAELLREPPRRPAALTEPASPVAPPAPRRSRRNRARRRARRGTPEFTSGVQDHPPPRAKEDTQAEVALPAVEPPVAAETSPPMDASAATREPAVASGPAPPSPSVVDGPLPVDLGGVPPESLPATEKPPSADASAPVSAAASTGSARPFRAFAVSPNTELDLPRHPEMEPAPDLLLVPDAPADPEPETASHPGPTPAPGRLRWIGIAAGLLGLALAGQTVLVVAGSPWLAGWGAHKPRPEAVPSAAAAATPISSPPQRPSAAPPPPSPSVLRVVSDPPGAAVIVDRKYRGQTPLRLELEPGSTPVLVRQKGFEPWRRKVTLVAGGEMRLDAALVAVTVEPSPSPTPSSPAVRLGDMVSLSGAVSPPRNVSPSGPSFPRPVPKVREETSVLVEFVVTEEGKVRDARVVESGGAVLDDICLEAVSGRRYEPAVYEGVRVKVRLQSRFTFRPR